MTHKGYGGDVNRGKHCSKFIQPFEMLENFGDMVYSIDLPPHLSVVHPVFHVSLLK